MSRKQEDQRVDRLLCSDLSTWVVRWPSTHLLASYTVSNNSQTLKTFFLAILNSESDQGMGSALPDWLASAVKDVGAVEVPFTDRVVFILPSAQACLDLAILHREKASGNLSQLPSTVVITSSYGQSSSVRIKKMFQVAEGAIVGSILVVGEVIKVLQSVIRDMNVQELGSHRFGDLTPEERVVSIGDKFALADGQGLNGLDLYDHNFPILLDSFIGRDETVQQILKCITVTRLVTLTGCGGIGKTRLALHAGAYQLMKGFDVGRVIRLAHLRLDSEVAESIAKQIGVSVPTTEKVIEVYKSKKCIFIFDNCEHVLKGVRETALRILSHIPRSVIVTTSRECLDIGGEVVIDVQPLELPPVITRISSDQASQYSAVQLFVDRMSERVDGFCLTDKNANVVTSICRLLDGVPLAIEHAAGQAAYLGLKTCLDNLATGIESLKTSRAGDQRHRTIAATIEWSLSLLEDNERELLYDLSGINGHFKVDDAVAVSTAHAIPVKVEHDLLALVKKSLIARSFDENSDASYLILEPVRQHANSQLQIEHRYKVERNYLSHVANLIRKAFAYSDGEVSDVSFEDIAFRYSFVKATLKVAISEKEESALELCYKMSRYWTEYGPMSDGIELIVDALEACDSPISDDLRLNADNTLGVMLWFNGDIEEAIAQFEQTLESARNLNESEIVASVLTNLSGLEIHSGNLDVATTYITEAYDYFVNSSEALKCARCAGTYAHLLNLSGNHARAKQMLRETLTTFEGRIPEETRMGLLLNLSDAQRHAGQITESLTSLTTIMESAIGGHHPATLAPALLRSAYMLRETTDLTIPARLLGMALCIYDEHDSSVNQERTHLIEAVHVSMSQSWTADEVERQMAVGYVVDPDSRAKAGLSILHKTF